MTADEVSRIILDKIEKADIDTQLKRFLREILKLERQYWNQENVRYAKDYENLITQYAQEREG